MARKTGKGSGGETKKETNDQAAQKDQSVKRISNTLEIKAFIHCNSCTPDKPSGTSPAAWSRLDVGFTQWGLQVWCRRCECNVCNIDFEGAQHPADMTRTRPPK
jgi:hypothetical protein